MASSAAPPGLGRLLRPAAFLAASLLAPPAARTSASAIVDVDDAGADVVGGCRGTLETGYVDTVGSFGFMLDVSNDASVVPPAVASTNASFSGLYDLDIVGMDLYVRNLVDVQAEVYVRSDAGGEGYASYSLPEGQTLIDDDRWILVAEGTVRGRGPGIGSPIPEAAWKRNATIRPGETAGFYVTLKGSPDLRYRNTTKEEGEIQASDGILTVRVGRAWGEHPLRGDGSDVYFAPREFAGAFRYRAREGLCRSEAPSASPSALPSGVRSAEPSSSSSSSLGASSPSAAPASRNHSYTGDSEHEDMCRGAGELETTFEDGTGSYGILFDVVAAKEVTLTGIDLN
ncbi:hypothetical protein ACHAWF_001153, partial [Thalassiosira exigua]